MDSKKQSEKYVYTEKQMAEMFDMSVSGFRKYRYAGIIGYIKPGKVFHLHEDLVDFCKLFRVPPKPSKKSPPKKSPPKKTKAKKNNKGGNTLAWLLMLMPHYEELVACM